MSPSQGGRGSVSRCAIVTPSMSAMQPERPIYIIDDDDEVCRSLTRLLQTMKGLAPRTWPSSDAFLVDLDLLAPGTVITDICMPGTDGLMLIAAMRARARPDPIVVVTGHADVPLAVQALKAGAADFLEKPFETDNLLAVIEHLNQQQVASHPRALHPQMSALSKREFEVFECLVEGATNKQIAYRLAISPRTVEIYRANLMAKMQANSLSHLVRMGLEAGLGRQVPK